MKPKYILLIVFLVVLLSCQTEQSNQEDLRNIVNNQNQGQSLQNESNEQIIIPTNILFENLNSEDDLSDIEKNSIPSINSLLKNELVQSPYFNLILDEQEYKILHGKITKSGNYYYITANLTDFENKIELVSANYKFLSLTDFSYAIKQVVLQLEGREILANSNVNDPISLTVINEIPEIQTDDLRLKQMYNLFNNELMVIEDHIMVSEYNDAFQLVEQFQSKYTELLTEEYQGKMYELFLHAEELRDISLDYLLLELIDKDIKISSNLLENKEYEKILFTFDSLIKTVIENKRENSNILNSRYEYLTEKRSEFEKLCKKVMYEKSNEFQSNINLYAFQYDNEGLKKSFLEFGEYGSNSRYWDDYIELFQESYFFYKDKFDINDVFIEYREYLIRYNTKIFPNKDEYINLVNQVFEISLVNIPSGTLTRQYYDDERIQSFYMSKYETTFTAYDLYCTDMNLSTVSVYTSDRGRKPINGISWIDAALFCNWLNQKIGLKARYQISGDNIYINRSQTGFRLPTVDEWEYVALGSGSYFHYDYPGSNDLFSVAWIRENANSNIKNVGQKIPSRNGIYDLIGNVSEMCEDLSELDDPAYAKHRISKGVNVGSNQESASKWLTTGGLLEPNTIYFATGIRLVFDFY